MAKLTAPLFSFSASGKLADSLVYMTWKGINDVRQYVVPANPKTAAQIIQRDYVKAAVAKIHAALIRATHALVAADKSAYALWGSNEAGPRTWFNQAVKNWVHTKVKVKIPIIFSDGQTTSKLHTSAVMQVYLNEEVGSSLVAGTFYLGTSKTSMIQTAAASVTAGSHASNGANPYTTLVAGVTYFWQFRANVADPCEHAESGIYYFTAT